MNTPRLALLLAALLGFAAGSRVFAAETKWTPAQQEIVAAVDAWAAAFESGDLDRIMGHTAPAFSCWEFSKPRWKSRAEYRESEAAFYRTNRVTGCELAAALIEIDGDTAAAQGRHTIHVEAASGAKRTLQGSWSASLIRRNRQWRFLNLAWIDDRPATDAAAIQAEVAQAMNSFVAACEKADLAGALAFMAEVPEFRYADPEGKLLDFATTKQGLAEWFGQCSAQRVLTARQEIAVLGPDAALVQWHGALELVLKEGKTLRAEPYNASFLFRRAGGSWKIAYQHESGPPPQPAGAAQPPATDAATIKAEVARAIDSLKAAVEKVDLAGTLGAAADVPDFRYVMPDGAVADFAGWKQGHSEYFTTVVAHHFFPKSQDIAVLGPDATLVTWTGAMEAVPKEGAALRVDPFSASFVFKRIGGAWKLVAQHESGPPPQPAGTAQPTTNVEAQLRSADTELVAAANARDLTRWMACFEDSARMFPPDGPPIAGKAAIRPAAEELMKGPVFAVVHRVDGVEVSPCGTLAWVDYAFELTIPGPDGRAVTETGRDTTLYRRGPDGRWRVVADLWQPHTPAAGKASVEVTTVLDDYLAAVNARDAARFLALVAANADLTVFENNELRFTHRELADYVAGFFRDYSGIRATWEKRTVHELAPTAAVATGTFKVEAKDAKGAPLAFRNAFTFVLTKPADRWLVQHIHESTLTP